MAKKQVKYFRAQFWLTKEQKVAIAKYAKKEKCKMSKVVRDVIDDYIYG